MHSRQLPNDLSAFSDEEIKAVQHHLEKLLQEARTRGLVDLLSLF